jgi:hypothetical protein
VHITSRLLKIVHENTWQHVRSRTASRKGGVTLDSEEPCGKWMPRKKTRCARKPGHGGACKTSEAMALAVKRKAKSVRVNGRRRYPETKRRWRQTYRVSHGIQGKAAPNALSPTISPPSSALWSYARSRCAVWRDGPESWTLPFLDIDESLVEGYP